MKKVRSTPQFLAAVMDEFSRRLAHKGLHDALGYLNARTRHRFTGVYRFAPPVLKNVSLFDRENPQVRSAMDALLRDTYCSHIADTGEEFGMDDGRDALSDIGTPRSVLAYHGVPLRDERDVCVGSLCHWDVRPRLVPDGEWAVLYAVAPLVSRAMVLEPAGMQH